MVLPSCSWDQPDQASLRMESGLLNPGDIIGMRTMIITAGQFLLVQPDKNAFLNRFIG